MSAWRTIRTHTWVVQHWVILCPQSVNRMLITIQSSLTVPFLALQSVRHVTSSSMSLLSLKDRGKVPDQGEPGVWKRQDKEFQWNRLEDQSFFLFFFSPALISLSFFPLQWEVAVFVFNHSFSFMCPLKRCAAVVANQLWSSAAQRAHGRRELSACFHPSLIQNHDWSSTTPRSSYLPRAVDQASGEHYRRRALLSVEWVSDGKVLPSQFYLHSATVT